MKYVSDNFHTEAMMRLLGISTYAVVEKETGHKGGQSDAHYVAAAVGKKDEAMWNSEKSSP